MIIFQILSFLSISSTTHSGPDHHHLSRNYHNYQTLFLPHSDGVYFSTKQPVILLKCTSDSITSLLKTFQYLHISDSNPKPLSVYEAVHNLHILPILVSFQSLDSFFLLLKYPHSFSICDSLYLLIHKACSHQLQVLAQVNLPVRPSLTTL